MRRRTNPLEGTRPDVLAQILPPGAYIPGGAFRDRKEGVEYAQVGPVFVPMPYAYISEVRGGALVQKFVRREYEFDGSGEIMRFTDHDLSETGATEDEEEGNR
jgi:hypothetical protein